MGDSGLDYKSCFLIDRLRNISFSLKDKNDHRKIARYYDLADNSDYNNGRGTHLAGTLVGETDGAFSDVKVNLNLNKGHFFQI